MSKAGFHMFHSVMPGTGGSFKPSHWLVLNLVFTNVGLIAKTDMIYTAVAFFNIVHQNCINLQVLMSIMTLHIRKEDRVQMQSLLHIFHSQIFHIGSIVIILSILIVVLN